MKLHAKLGLQEVKDSEVQDDKKGVNNSELHKQHADYLKSFLSNKKYKYKIQLLLCLSAMNTTHTRHTEARISSLYNSISGADECAQFHALAPSTLKETDQLP